MHTAVLREKSYDVLDLSDSIPEAEIGGKSKYSWNQIGHLLMMLDDKCQLYWVLYTLLCLRISVIKKVLL